MRFYRIYITSLTLLIFLENKLTEPTFTELNPLFSVSFFLIYRNESLIGVT